MTRTTLGIMDIAVIASALVLALATVATAAGMGHRSTQLQTAQPQDILEPQVKSQVEPQVEPQPEVRFKVLDIMIDAGDARLAAYQFELIAPEGTVLVGVENGEHAAFADAPHYDPAAINSGRIIVAAFNTGDDLPSGKTRVCRLHVQETGSVTYDISLTVAADADGNAIDASITIHEE